jgi:hypothetical protein
VRLHRLSGYEQGGSDLGIVLAATRNPGDLKFLGAECVEPVVCADPVLGALILCAGRCQFRPRARRPWSRAETLEKYEGLMERLTRSDRTAVTAHRLPGAQEDACLFECDGADLVQCGEGFSK